MYVRWLREWMPLLDENTDTGGGKSDKVRGSDMLERYGGDVVRMSERLAEMQNERFGDREKIRTHEITISDLKKRVSPDGAMVLTGDDASRWQAYQTLGKTPDELTQALKDANDAMTERDTLKRQSVNRDVAGLVGYDPDVLADRMGAMETEVREVEQDGQKRRVPYVKDGANVVPLTDYAQQHWTKYLPALTTAPQQPTATHYPPQHGGGGNPTDFIDSLIASRLKQ